MIQVMDKLSNYFFFSCFMLQLINHSEIRDVSLISFFNSSDLFLEAKFKNKVFYWFFAPCIRFCLPPGDTSSADGLGAGCPPDGCLGSPNWGAFRYSCIRIPDMWIRVFLRIRLQEAKYLECFCRILSTHFIFHSLNFFWNLTNFF